MEQIHLTSDMLVSDAPGAPLSPFRTLNRGATAFWHMVRGHYPALRKKTERDHVKGAIRAAFIRGWTTNRDGGQLRLDRIANMYVTSKHAEPAHLIAAHVNGFDFYAEQFPLEDAA